MDEIKDDLGVSINYTGIDKLVPEAECNNRTIAERIRVAYHHLPYKIISKIILRYLAMACTKQLNIFPAKGGASHIIVHMHYSMVGNMIMPRTARYSLEHMSKQTIVINQPIPMH